MRIIAGKYKNRVINTKVKGKNSTNIVGYRPTTSKVRTAIFNILENSQSLPDNLLKNARVIDICCGCGSFGIESISRGAEFVTFIDNNIAALNLVKSNLSNLNIDSNNVEVIAKDVLKLTNPSPDNANSYNLVYIDLPYNKADETIVVIDNLIKKNWLSTNCTIIAELPIRVEIDERYNKLTNLDLRKYGNTKIMIWCN